VQYEQIARIFFETFNSPGLYIANQALMALYGCGSKAGQYLISLFVFIEFLFELLTFIVIELIIVLHGT
jgi:actin-related protein